MLKNDNAKNVVTECIEEGNNKSLSTEYDDNIVIFRLEVRSFKKMINPLSGERTNQVKYVCYADCRTLPDGLLNWMGTNPREQKMSTNVAKRIQDSLECESNFHELNRGILLSAEKVVFDNGKNIAQVTMSDPERHGNIDGGHTLRTILEAKNSNKLDERYVFMEIITDVIDPIKLAEARNTSVQVDLKSIEELKKSFDTLKDVFESLCFSKRIQYKMNEDISDRLPEDQKDLSVIDVREIIALTIMFSNEIYPVKDVYGNICNVFPIQCYSGKEASLKKFLNVKKRDSMLKNMKDIVSDIFDLYEVIETEFSSKGTEAKKRYGSRKYSKFDNNNPVGKSFIKGSELRYIVPKGLIYPLLGAFRALIQVDDKGLYSWKVSPFEIWEKLGSQLVAIVLDEKIENPDVIAKNSNLWNNLFKEVFIRGYLVVQ